MTLRLGGFCVKVARMITRRGLGAAALAVGVGWATKARAARPAARGVLLGVQSYSFRDRPLPEALAAMSEVGAATCELWQGHLEPQLPKGASAADKAAHREAVRRWRLEVPLDKLRAVALDFQRAKVPLCAFNYSFKDDYSDAEIDRGFLMAKALGVKAITASAHQTVVARVAPAAKRHRIKVAMHNHSKIHPNEFATPDDFERAMAGKDRAWIAINLDIGHFTAANFDPVAFLEKHHNQIVTLHIKDRKRDQGANLPFGEGDTPIKAVLTLLRDHAWAIPANIEYEYAGGDAKAEVKRCLEFCRGVLQ